MPRRVDFSAELILVCNSLDAGGIERVVATLANEWSRRGRRVCVISLHDRRRFYRLDTAIHHVIIDRAGFNRLADLLRWIASHLRSHGPANFRLLSVLLSTLYDLSYKRLYRTYSAIVYGAEAVLLRRALSRIKSPVIISFGTPINIIALKACRKSNRRLIISERNDPKRLSGHKSWGVLARKLYNRADLVTANTRSALRDMSSYVDPGKLAFVPNPLILSDGNGHNGNGFAADHTLLPHPPVILNVGRMVWDKAQEVLLEAFALLGDDFEHWRLSAMDDLKLIFTHVQPPLVLIIGSTGTVSSLTLTRSIVAHVSSHYRRALKVRLTPCLKQ